MELVNSTSLYKGHIFEVLGQEFSLDESDHRVFRDVVVKSPVVAVLPVTEDGKVYLVQQDRVGNENKPVLEVPAGHIDEGESVTEAMSRELQEEIGKRPRKLTVMPSFLVSPGFTNETVTLAIAEYLVDSKLEAEDTSEISIVKMDAHSALNVTTDLKTAFLLMTYLSMQGVDDEGKQ